MVVVVVYCMLKFFRLQTYSNMLINTDEEAKTEVAKNYYLTEVDKLPDSIYCMHDAMGEEGIKPHQHQKNQLLFTQGGLVFVKVEGITYFLPARHFMWIPAGLEHSIHPGSANVIMRNLYFPTDLSDLNFERIAGIYPVNDLLLNMILFTKQWVGDLTINEKEAYTFTAAIAFILPQISKNRLPLMLPLPKDKRLVKIVEYMADEMHTSIKLSELATKFGFSERSLSRLFKTDLGMSFVQYHTIQRLLKALHLLIQKKRQIKEVAMLVGYNSIPTFTATFRKMLGTSPLAYVSQIGVI
jgi:AraC-like DNA-binding protein